MAKGAPANAPPPRGPIARLHRRLGRQPAPGEGQYVVAAYAVVTVALVLSPFITTEVPDPSGRLAPDFTLQTTGGGSFHLDPTNLGRPVMVEFMHPDCGHCKAVSDNLNSAHTAYGNQVEFVSVAIPLAGLGQPTMEEVQRFKTDYGHSWTYCLATDNNVAAAYGVGGTPTFFFVSANGTIRSTQVGEISYNVFAASLDQIIGG